MISTLKILILLGNSLNNFMIQEKFNDVPIFILCGGMGTRMKEETEFKPKPMVDICGKPVVFHIMRSYAAHGFRNFVLCLGFKSGFVKDFFLNRKYLAHDFSVSSEQDGIKLLSSNKVEDWKIDLVDTGINCMTGGRIARAYDRYYHDCTRFGVTYGDGLCDLNIGKSFEFHKLGNSIGTITGVNPVSRFGELKTEGDSVTEFLEKPVLNDQWINGGYFFFNSKFREYLSTDQDCVLEQEPLKKLSEDNELRIFKHSGFWRCMDTQRDKEELEELYKNGEMQWLR